MPSVDAAQAVRCHPMFTARNERLPCLSDPCHKLQLTRQLEDSMAHVGRRSLCSRQFIEQRLGFLQDRRIEAFGEPTVDRRDQIASFRAPALVAPEPSETGG